MIGAGAGRRGGAARTGALVGAFAGWVVLCAGLAGCGTWSPDYRFESNRLAIVREAADSYSTDLRWGRLKEAAALVAPEHRVAFLEFFEDPKQPFHFTSSEIISVDLTDQRDRMEVLVSFELYRPPSIRERTVRDRQVWRFHVPTRRWLVEPDLGPFVGEPAGVSSGAKQPL